MLDQRAAERLFPLAQRHHVSISARTPLASGALSGRWHTAMKFHRADWRRRVFRGEVLERTIQRVSQVRALFEPGVEWFSLRDRKSTRLNSSHQIISYAVFCLKKKKQMRRRLTND